MKTKIETEHNGIVRINDKIVGVMFDPKKTNMAKVIFKYYKSRMMTVLEEWGKAAAYAIHR